MQFFIWPSPLAILFVQVKFQWTQLKYLTQGLHRNVLFLPELVNESSHCYSGSLYLYKGHQMLQQHLWVTSPFEDFIHKTEEYYGVRDALQLQRSGWVIHAYKCRDMIPRLKSLLKNHILNLSNHCAIPYKHTWDASLPTNLIAFFGEMTDAVDKKWMLFPWVFTTAFEIVILILKPVNYKLDVEMRGKLAGLLGWKKIWLAVQVQLIAD